MTSKFITKTVHFYQSGLTADKEVEISVSEVKFIEFMPAGWSYINSAQVTVQLPESFDPVQNAVAALQKAIEREREEGADEQAKRRNTIRNFEQQISNLLAIDCECREVQAQ